jgi:ubiquinone/menaquinone biosynthesis C-methylase UbiE
VTETLVRQPETDAHAGPQGDAPKALVRDFWEAASCGEVYLTGATRAEQLAQQARTRYKLEPYIHDFARFQDARDRDVLEIGVGLGADHFEWAKHAPRTLTGVDLTPRAVGHTKARFALFGGQTRLINADAERLPLADGSFDLVYSWGVIHCSPDTEQAVREIWRVLRPGGTARVMIYHTYSMVGYMLWLRYGLLAGKPGRSLADIYARHLESPGTKAYTMEEAQAMFRQFSRVRTETMISFGDLLQGAVGQQHQGWLLSLAKRIWPRRLIARMFPYHGLYLLIEAVK